MFVVQGDRAVNLELCKRIIVTDNSKEILGVMLEDENADSLGYSIIAKFDTHEQAQEYLSMILKAYAAGEKVFYC